MGVFYLDDSCCGLRMLDKGMVKEVEKIEYGKKWPLLTPFATSFTVFDCFSWMSEMALSKIFY